MGLESRDLLSQRLAELASEFVAGEKKLPSRWEPQAPPLDLELGAEGRSVDTVLTELGRIMDGTPSAAGPLFANQLFGGRDDVATLAEMLTPLANTSMYTYKVAGPQVLVERAVLRRMLEVAGMVKGEGVFCPGGSLANLTAMLIARNERYPELRDNGRLPTPPVLYTSVDGHYSIRKNAGILGLGRDSVRDVPVDGSGHMDVRALERMIADDRAAGLTPLLVNATAGTTVLGAYDPIRAIAAVCRRHKIWLHVDGALGASALLSGRHRRLLDGVDLADSLAWNAHKMMGVPLACSALLLRRPKLLAKHLNETADYLFQSEADEFNPGTRSIQCGRRNDALKLWAAWRHLGDRGYERRIDRLFDLATYFASQVKSDPELELVMPPESVNVCFRVRGRSSAAVCERLDATGRLKVGHGRAAGQSAIRFVCVNPDFTKDHLAFLLDEIKAAGREIGE